MKLLLLDLVQHHRIAALSNPDSTAHLFKALPVILTTLVKGRNNSRKDLQKVAISVFFASSINSTLLWWDILLLVLQPSIATL